MNKKLIFIPIIAVAVIVLLQVNFSDTIPIKMTGDTTQDQAVVQRSSVTANVNFVVRDSNGIMTQNITEHNLVVNRGLNFTRSNVFANSNPTTTMKYIALGTGNSNPVLAQTSLDTEILIVSSSPHTTHPHYMRGIATVNYNIALSGDIQGTVQLVKVFSVVDHNTVGVPAEGQFVLATGGSQQIQEAGIFDSSTAGNMFARIRLVGGDRPTLDIGDTLTVTWSIDFD